MREFKYTATCKAIYRSSIMVPDDFSKEEAIKYLKGKIAETAIGNLEYIPDTDQIIEDLSGFVRERPETIKWSEMDKRPEDTKPIFLRPEIEEEREIVLRKAE